MRTIRLEEPGRFALFTNEECATSLNPDEALVRVHRIGICGTDIHAYRGNQPFFRYPRILGHELGVEVVAVGSSSTNVRPGDRCSVEPYLNCGHCIACRRGKTNCCVNLQVLGVHTDGCAMPLSFPFHRRELTLLSSRNARPEDFVHIISLVENARLDTAAWITHRAAFADAIVEFPRWTRPETGVIKAMIEVS